MNTLRKVPFELVDVEYIPEVMEPGKIYYSKEYSVSNHICPCGCEQQTPLPIKSGEWNLSISNNKVTITPSIQHLNNCKSHYVITDGVANILNHPIPKKDWGKRHGFEDSQPGE